jgi:hypothetical protein
MTESGRRPAGVSPVVLVLSVFPAAAATGAAILALRPAGPRVGGRESTDEPFTQKDTVSPRDHATGQVFYPVPFATKPNVKLASQGHDYEVVREDEFGFVWTVRVKSGDIKPEFFARREGIPETVSLAELQAAIGNLRPGLVFEDFTWEARGVRGGKIAVPFEQTGRFIALPNTDGEVIFPVPYAQPANVELSNNQFTTVTECRANGFKWKNVCEKGKEFFAQGNVDWVSKGVRPTDGK